MKLKVLIENYTNDLVLGARPGEGIPIENFLHRGHTDLSDFCLSIGKSMIFGAYECPKNRVKKVSKKYAIILLQEFQEDLIQLKYGEKWMSLKFILKLHSRHSLLIHNLIKEFDNPDLPRKERIDNLYKVTAEALDAPNNYKQNKIGELFRNHVN